MVKLSDIVLFLNNLLEIGKFSDFDGAYNGIQVQNSGEVRSIACATDCGLFEIESAKRLGANLLIVHHGMFWDKPIPLVESNYKKVKSLIDGDIAVYSVHLPLDAHRVYGHSSILAKLLRLKVVGGCFNYCGNDIGILVKTPIGGRDEIATRLKKIFPKTYKGFEFGSSKPKNVAICSGSASTSLQHLLEQGTDTLICGEIKQGQYTFARDNNLNVYPCGHYATECFGVRALGDLISKKFRIESTFIDTDNPL